MSHRVNENTELELSTLIGEKPLDLPSADEDDSTCPASGKLPDVVVVGNHAYDHIDEPKETYLKTAIQVFIPFLIAGKGMVGAGLVLDIVQVSLFFHSIHPSPFI